MLYGYILISPNGSPIATYFSKKPLDHQNKILVAQGHDHQDVHACTNAMLHYEGDRLRWATDFEREFQYAEYLHKIGRA